MEKKTSTNRENNIKEENKMEKVKNETDEISREVKLSKIENYEIVRIDLIKEVSVWRVDEYNNIYIARCLLIKEDNTLIELIFTRHWLDEINETINILRLLKNISKDIKEISISHNNVIRLYKEDGSTAEEIRVKAIRKKIK